MSCIMLIVIFLLQNDEQELKRKEDIVLGTTESREEA